jgi:hypothetical protein
MMSFATFLLDVLVVFAFIMWFWLLITVMGDLLRRDDVSGFGKVIWIILLVVLPYVGVFAYLLTQGSSMATRQQAQAHKARDELRAIVGFSAADEIEKLGRLKADGTITAEEYARLRSRALA